MEEQKKAEVQECVSSPLPVMGEGSWTDWLYATVVVVGSGMFLFPFMGLETHTMGATVSARMQWQQRKGQIERAIAESEQAPAQEAQHGDAVRAQLE
jgi:hypothetical protein